MSSTETEPRPDLEPFTTTPTGGAAPRCQRVKRSGDQCQNPVRHGYKICSAHGAGRGSTRPGRPVTHGTYSVTPTTDVNNLMAETAQLEDVLESSDRDLLALKASLLYLLGELDRHAPKVDQVAAGLEHLETQAADLSPEDALQIAGRFPKMREAIREMNHLTSQVADTASKSINAHKVRAETSARLAEQRGVRVAVQLVQAARQIVHDLSQHDGNLRDSYELALRREIYGPLRLEPPDVSTPPELI